MRDGMNKYKKNKKKHRAIAPAALGGCGGLGQLWEALAELRQALGELWEGLYIQKLPINRPSGRYVNLLPLVISSLSLLYYLPLFCIVSERLILNAPLELAPGTKTR